MLLGSYEAGHERFGLALNVGALIQDYRARHDAPIGWVANVYCQSIDTAAFVGHDEFVAQTDHFVEQCHMEPPLDPKRLVRVSGEQAISPPRSPGRTGYHYLL